MSFLQAMRDGVHVPWRRVAAVLLIGALICAALLVVYDTGGMRGVYAFGGAAISVAALCWAINVLAQ